jgi:hydroxymethylpyrimidine/phosphomethylpyrimidine kinase
VQADLKTFAALGVYGFCAISSVTAQNSTDVTHVEALSPESFAAQLRAVASDFRVDAVKVGLLGNPANTLELSVFLAECLPEVPAVVDPVMVSAAGHVFLDDGSVEALKALLKQAYLTTPNLPEAEKLSGVRITSKADCIKAADRILALGPKNVLIKGGHSRTGASDDLLLGKDAPEGHFLTAPKIRTDNNHGTGCTLSSAIAAFLALGEKLPEAAALAKRYVLEAMDPSHGFVLGGKGHGPLHHFYRYYGFDPEP